MNIAIASSGLGHVSRGIETWALDLSSALAERGMEVTLFAGAAVGTAHSAERIAHRGEAQIAASHACFDAAPTFGGSGRSLTPCAMPRAPCSLRIRVLPCLRRSGIAARLMALCLPGFCWRWGLKSAYGVEQFSFWIRLWPQLRRGAFDIIHVQDPIVGLWAQIFRNHGWIPTRVILAHGTEEPPEFLERFEYVQHLAPWHAEPGKS